MEAKCSLVVFAPDAQRHALPLTAVQVVMGVRLDDHAAATIPVNREGAP
ncbi:MAG: hypothetical protein ABIJ09_21875 [Pseudomonadota bacterium]